MARSDDILARMRAICLALPEAHETDAWGHPNFKAGRKTFAALEEYRGELALCFKCTLPQQDMLVADPRFRRSPYVGESGWVSMRVQRGPIPWRQVEAFLIGSYRLVALKRMLAALDAPSRRGRNAR